MQDSVSFVAPSDKAEATQLVVGIPALFTKMVGLPKLAFTLSANLLMEVGFDMSSC